MSRPPLPAVVAMDPHVVGEVFPSRLRTRLEETVELVVPGPLIRFDETELSRIGAIETLITGWGSPKVTEDVLDALPNLRAVVHAGGSVKGHLSSAVWERGIDVSAAPDIGAVPVADFTVAAVRMAAKGAVALSGDYRTTRRFPQRPQRMPYGLDGLVVGVVGASRIGQLVIAELRSRGYQVLLYDPYVGTGEAARLGACWRTLAELLAQSDIVTLHASSTPETYHMIDGAGLARMRPGATLINTARGGLVDHHALTQACAEGRVHAILDVTEPEPLPPNHPLFDLPNVWVTPHLSGLHGSEVARLGEFVLGELDALRHGWPLTGLVDPTQLSRSA